MVESYFNDLDIMILLAKQRIARERVCAGMCAYGVGGYLPNHLAKKNVLNVIVFE